MYYRRQRPPKHQQFPRIRPTSEGASSCPVSSNYASSPHLTSEVAPRRTLPELEFSSDDAYRCWSPGVASRRLVIGKAYTVRPRAVNNILGHINAGDTLNNLLTGGQSSKLYSSFSSSTRAKGTEIEIRKFCPLRGKHKRRLPSGRGFGKGQMFRFIPSLIDAFVQTDVATLNE
jgi:hypothetical protein